MADRNLHPVVYNAYVATVSPYKLQVKPLFLMVHSLLNHGCNYDSTPIRPRYDHSTTYVTTGLLHK